MRHSSRHRRAGYSLMEMMAVMALIAIVGLVVGPTLTGMVGANNVKGAADLCVARLVDARSYAVDEGRAYRVSSSPDGRQIRVSVDEVDGSGQAQVSPEVPAHTITTDLPPTVTLQPPANPTPSNDGWIHLVTFQPNGTCPESDGKLVAFQLMETGTVSYEIQVRCLTGSITVAPLKPNGGK